MKDNDCRHSDLCFVLHICQGVVCEYVGDCGDLPACPSYFSVTQFVAFSSGLWHDGYQHTDRLQLKSQVLLHILWVVYGATWYFTCACGHFIVSSKMNCKFGEFSFISHIWMGYQCAYRYILQLLLDSMVYWCFTITQQAHHSLWTLLLSGFEGIPKSTFFKLSRDPEWFCVVWAYGCVPLGPRHHWLWSGGNFLRVEYWLLVSFVSNIKILYFECSVCCVCVGVNIYGTILLPTHV